MAARGRSDIALFAVLAVVGGFYVLLIAGMLVADVCHTTPEHLWDALRTREIRNALKLSLLSCTATTILSLWAAVPLGYLMSRFDFRGKMLLDVLLDVPIVLPPLVIGLSLLILFSTPPGRWLQQGVTITYAVPAVVIAQFAVAAAFAVRTMRVTFDQLPRRQEDVAMTLGCNRAQAFFRVVLPQARRGMVTAATLAWARALGEFGPVLVFAGTNPNKTLVLPTAMWLEITIANLEAAFAVSLLMVAVAMAVLVLMRLFGTGLTL
jgi:molybdate transport system permease protein